MTQPVVGYVGMGRMGGGMVKNLLRHGYTVHGFDASPARMEEAAGWGVRAAASPGQAMSATGLVLCSLPTPASMRAAWLDEDGLLAAARPGDTIIDASTVPLSLWRELAGRAQERGVTVVDAPVSGGPAEAEAGTLTVIAGGEPEVVERHRELFHILGSHVHHVGPSGLGHVTKLVNNAMSMANMAVAAEAMALGVRAGADPGKLFDVISTAGGRSHHFVKRFPRVLSGEFGDDAPITLALKDLALIQELGAEMGMPLAVMALVTQLYRAAAARGHGGLDMAAVVRVYEEWAGVEVRRRSGG